VTAALSRPPPAVCDAPSLTDLSPYDAARQTATTNVATVSQTASRRIGKRTTTGMM
jgi:hypothetical protein